MLLKRALVFLYAISLLAQAPPQLDAWVERTMREFDVPGIAVAIVKDGKVVATKGYGVRKLGNPARVDEHTLFGIASNTKAFTTAALAILVDEGKLSWDDPVTKHLPSFAMYDPYVTRELRVRDLVSHKTGLGLGAGDLMFWPDTTLTRDQVMAAVKSIKPASSFRSTYAYNNLMFVVAGEVIHAVSGKSYEDFIRERIFTPLGMTETRMTNNGLRDTDNTAVPHSRGWRLEGELKPIPWTRDEVWAPAAGVKANVTDLAKWMLVQIAQGEITPGGKRLFSQRASRQMWSMQTVTPVGQAPPELADAQAQFAGYGLGWALKDYRGRKVVTHGGGLTGMVTQTTILPQLNLGVVVLTNQEEGGAFQALTNLLVDHYLGVASPDWIGAVKASGLKRRVRDGEREHKAIAARSPNTQPYLPLAAYAADYRDAWYGMASVESSGAQLRLRMRQTPAMQGRLEHWHYNTFVAHWDDQTIPDAYVTFSFDAQGKVTGMKMEAISDLADFSFDFQDLDFKRSE